MFLNNFIEKYRRLIKRGLPFEISLSTPKFSLYFTTFERDGSIVRSQKAIAVLSEKNTQHQAKHPLLKKLEQFISANLQNEQFGVEQLADMVGMSRSHLHRKLHKIKGKSISRFIREYRLEAAREMLIEKEMTASEVSHAVGFGSPSYFNKCFTEYFGYSPGKARLKVGQEITRKTESRFLKNKSWLWIGGLAAVVLIAFLFFSANKKEGTVTEAAPKEKSIIVLPFKNLSADEENQYLADGMVDAISRHLNSIDDLKVLSTLAMLQFDNKPPSLKAINEELGVSNILRGSIQRNVDLIRLEVSLVSTIDENNCGLNNMIGNLRMF